MLRGPFSTGVASTYSSTTKRSFRTASIPAKAGFSFHEGYLLFGGHIAIVHDDHHLRVAFDHRLPGDSVQLFSTSSMMLRPPAASIMAVGMA
jgi:hypothetical protein